ncbi:HEAT repeat domain-containing protein [Uliginosibacterium sp. 31-12]|uniref:HEAT repeat domain-containing protein n=1 Tax=Uliginosibacterium sp. 31-12 TaxID=3062781 RepID=UPI0026E214F8|nr:hypothetical protein [Uliginosibacterium sp. 31-12]MDO6388484.1 hypothetical protein [Uliginosibacterium sp. 31-12]
MELSAVNELFTQLEDSKSAKRRSAAKKLRKLKNGMAGPALLDALKKEVEDTRTWETQYQIVMALGECEYKDALPYLVALSGCSFEATMVYMALGDAIVRLSRAHPNDISSVFDLIGTGNEMLIDGGLRAVAMLRLVPDESEISKLLEFVEHYDLNHHLRFWVLAAAPGWNGQKLEQFVEKCATSTRQDIAQAASLAHEKKYKKWQPL